MRNSQRVVCIFLSNKMNGFIPALQTSSFGRVYVTYGGVFIVLSILWGWKIDGITPPPIKLDTWVP
jgi:drug/metabolite transporter superfamily protein YnfA